MRKQSNVLSDKKSIKEESKGFGVNNGSNKILKVETKWQIKKFITSSNNSCQ
jgi:hypothetical protein